MSREQLLLVAVIIYAVWTSGVCIWALWLDHNRHK